MLTFQATDNLPGKNKPQSLPHAGETVQMPEKFERHQYFHIAAYDKINISE